MKNWNVSWEGFIWMGRKGNGPVAENESQWQPRDGLGGSRGDDLELVGWWGSGGGEEENWICGGL